MNETTRDTRDEKRIIDLEFDYMIQLLLAFRKHII